MRTHVSFLKWPLILGLLVLGGAAIHVGPAEGREPASGQATGKRQHKPVVFVDGQPLPDDFTGATGFSTSIPAADLDGDGAPDLKTYQPGQPVYGNITFTREGVPPKSDPLLTWFQAAARGTNIRKSISVVITRRDGSEAMRYDLIDCFPVRFSPPEVDPDGDATVLRWQLEVRVERIEMK